MLSEEKERHFILELCLHCADVSNPYKPFALCEKWAKLVAEEFSLQGDREKAEGLEVSPMCDRFGINLPNFQMGFIEFVVAPLILTVVQLFYPLHPIGDNILKNFLEWGKKRCEEILSDNSIVDKEEEMEKVNNRMEIFKAKFAVLDELREKPIRPDISRARLYQRGNGDQQNNTLRAQAVSGRGGKAGLNLKMGTPRQKKILGKDTD